jgi:formate C-acetyltransferase
MELLSSYMKEIDLLKAPSNIPFAICGTDENENDLTNELSYIWLDIYEKAQTNNTKLHVLCSEKTPTDIIEKALRCVRDGNNSIVFLSDERVITSLEKQGAEHNDAVNYHIVGCYECGAEGELTCSCNARVNVPKALELALNGGRDMQTNRLIGLETERKIESYEDLVLEFERQLRYCCECAMKITGFYESHYREIHSSPFLSGTYASALEKGGDLYCDYTAKYNNSSLNALGLATATDSLAAIRKLVYEDKTLSLDELTETLKSDWKDREPLRRLVKNKYPKYGQGNRQVDDIAKRIVDVLSDTVSYKENVRGGNWRLGLFSIDWRWAFGEKTAASADGRHSGETLSQNASASFGADKEGATAHLISGASVDTTKTPNGTIIDIDLHSSAVRGENGIKALLTSLKTYFKLGGFAVQYNIMDTEILKDAKRNPEKYPTLQVRLCGWNVLFSTLSEKEKDEFIARSMK